MLLLPKAGFQPLTSLQCYVTSLLKKPHLDVADLHSYRPISNLSFVSEILERVIDSKFTQHVNTFD